MISSWKSTLKFPLSVYLKADIFPNIFQCLKSWRSDGENASESGDRRLEIWTDLSISVCWSARFSSRSCRRGNLALSLQLLPAHRLGPVRRSAACGRLGSAVNSDCREWNVSVRLCILLLLLALVVSFFVVKHVAQRALHLPPYFTSSQSGREQAKEKREPPVLNRTFLQVATWPRTGTSWSAALPSAQPQRTAESSCQNPVLFGSGLHPAHAFLLDLS